MDFFSLTAINLSKSDLITTNGTPVFCITFIPEELMGQLPRKLPLLGISLQSRNSQLSKNVNFKCKINLNEVSNNLTALLRPTGTLSCIPLPQSLHVWADEADMKTRIDRTANLCILSYPKETLDFNEIKYIYTVNKYIFSLFMYNTFEPLLGGQSTGWFSAGLVLGKFWGLN